ncbi:MAG: carbohydrate porin [Deltaproteobacteria bacterium]|nr:carbohydrate porin [Deltaproteobacteria bacterium]
MRYLKPCVYLFLVFVQPIESYALDMENKLSLSGTVSTVNQWLKVTKDTEDNSGTKDRGSIIVDISLSFRPMKDKEFFCLSSFGKGDGLKNVNPFMISLNGDTLSSELKDISGHKRDHILELWYSERFEFKKERSIKIKAGIVDSAAFIDDNTYAGNELHQFMNEALVHSPTANLPSYDLGLLFEFETGGCNLRLVSMRSKNEIGKYYIWTGGQIGWNIKTTLGEGNYRLYVYTTNRRFESWSHGSLKALKGFGLSFDQKLFLEALGTFFRMGWQKDSAKVNFKEMYSIGLNLNGQLWRRKHDEIGMGCAYLRSPSRNEGVKSSQVFEFYSKVRLFGCEVLTSDLTIDYQYLRQKGHKLEGTKIGNVYGLRLNIIF